MAAVIDYTKQNVFTEFSGSSEEDVSYATNFWQSIQLHPPMESRLVSSDIKQRLKVAPPSSQARNVAPSIPEDSPVLQDFMTRAKTMEHIETYKRMQRFAEAKAEDKALLQKQREIRKKKEEVSRNKGVRQNKPDKENSVKKTEEYETLDAENDMDTIKQIDEFESKLGTQGTDSD